MDPLKITFETRDVFPKMGLDRKYIGDGFPLCADRPEKHFLKTGAKFLLLGRTSTPELQTDAIQWASDPLAVRLKLTSNGGISLLRKLCGSEDSSNCTLASRVILDEDVPCTGVECAVDTVRVVEISNGIFYEYVPAPCVHQAFFENPKAIVRQEWWYDVMCADPRTHVAMTACCKWVGVQQWLLNWTDVVS